MGIIAHLLLDAHLNKVLAHIPHKNLFKFAVRLHWNTGKEYLRRVMEVSDESIV